MKIAITGGTGFVGAHLTRALISRGVEVVIIARGHRAASVTTPEADVIRAETDDATALATAFTGCETVAHCAGINRELGRQSFERVHVEGTRAVIEAARKAGVRKLVLLSFLRARPGSGSGYHESKWRAEELVRASGMDYTILKAGMIYGLGDHMLDHLSRSLRTLPIFATVGLVEKPIRPLAAEDLVRIMVATLVDGRLTRETVAVTGPEELALSEAVRRVARAVGRRVVIVPAPVAVQQALACLFETVMRVPLVARAQVRMLAEGMTEPLPFAPGVPDDLRPTRWFTPTQIDKGLPHPARFGLADLRCVRNPVREM